MLAALRIVRDVLAYRLRRLEMANLVAAGSLLLALRAPPEEVVARSTFALLLNVLAYLTNDYYDVHRDLAAGRDEAKTLFLRDHAAEALAAQIALAVALAVLALAWDPSLLVAGAAGAGLCWAYSAKWKATPWADVVSMAAWGAAMPLAGVRLGDAVGLLLVGQLAWFSACFETLQVLRDRREDAEAGLRTTAVVLGDRGTARLARLLAVGCATYATLTLHAALGPAIAVAAVLPIDPSRTEQHWTRVRLIFGVVWLALLASIYFTGTTHGMLTALRVDAW